MKLLTKDQILGADDCETVEVETPEWGAGSGVLIRAMTGCERDSFELSILNLKGKGKGKFQLKANVRARLVSRCVVDKSGKRLFSDKEIVALGDKAAAPLSRIFDKCREISGMTEEDIEELEGN